MNWNKSRNEAFRTDDPNLFADPGSQVTVLGADQVNRALGNKPNKSILGS